MDEGESVVEREGVEGMNLGEEVGTGEGKRVEKVWVKAMDGGTGVG